MREISKSRKNEFSVVIYVTLNYFKLLCFNQLNYYALQTVLVQH